MPTTQRKETNLAQDVQSKTEGTNPSDFLPTGTVVMTKSEGKSIESILSDPSIDLLHQQSPALVPIVEEMIKEIDTNDLMALVHYGSDALETMAQAGMDVFTTIQDDTGSEISVELMRTQQSFQERIFGLQSEIDRRTEERKRFLGKDTVETIITSQSKNSDRKNSFLITSARKILTTLTDRNGEKAMAKRKAKMAEDMAKIDAIIQGQNEDSHKLLEACHKTASDLNVLQRVMFTNREKPSLIFEQTTKMREATEIARSLSLARLVALHEKKKMTDEEIRALQTKDKQSALSIEEMDKLAKQSRASTMMERRETDLLGTFLMTIKQTKECDLIIAATTDAGLERARQESQVLATITAVLGNLMNQNEITKLTTILQLGNKLQRDAMQASDEGMATLLRQREKVDNSIIDSTNAIADSARKTAAAIKAFAKQEEVFKGKLQGSRKNLIQAASTLALAAKEDQERREKELLGLPTKDTKTTALRPLPDKAASLNNKRINPS